MQIEQITEQQFEQLRALLSSTPDTETREVINALRDADYGTRFLVRKDPDEDSKPYRASFTKAQSMLKRNTEYDFKMSVRSLKDGTGFVLIKIPKD